MSETEVNLKIMLLVFMFAMVFRLGQRFVDWLLKDDHQESKD